MAILTLSFDEKNPLVKKTLDYILSLGIFVVVSKGKTSNKGKKITRELTAEEEKEAFLHTGKINSAKMIAKYL
jgi:hypothetical protein